MGEGVKLSNLSCSLEVTVRRQAICRHSTHVAKTSGSISALNRSVRLYDELASAILERCCVKANVHVSLSANVFSAASSWMILAKI